MEEFYHHQKQQKQQQPTWNSTIGDFNSYFTNCDDCFTGQPDPFDSAPTYLPVAPSEIGTGTDRNACQNGDSNAIIELIGRLGGNSNSNFHATSLNSQSDPTRNPNMGPPDLGFAERAARFSKFGSRSLYNEVGGGVGIGFQIPRVSSCHALRFPTGSPFGENKDEISKCDTQENEACSTVSDKFPQQNDLKKNPRKRKTNTKAKKEIGSLTQEDASDHDGNGAKRAKSNESDGNIYSGGSKNGKATGIIEDDTKDYIHVRARRGQATDSHSLAERVRREKISQRMKFLQDLVPGCNKVTGKAVMLDEIINYVQSLQRQVEFLSMKLSTLNPKTDINMEALLSKDLDQARSLLSQSMFALASSSTSPTFPYRYQSQGHPMKNAHPDRSEVSFSVSPLNTDQQSQRVQFSTMDEFEQSASQVSMWIDELHNGVQMGYGQTER